MKIRLDLISILRYAVIFVLVWLVLWQVLSLIPPIEAAPDNPPPILEEPQILFCPVPDAVLGKDSGETFVQSPDPFTREDLDLVVRTVACESPHEPPSGIRAVVHVIKTRVEKRGLSYEEVVKEPWQFSCWNSHILPSLKELRDEPRATLGVSRYKALKWIAMGVMSGSLSNPFPGADLYYSHCSISPPSWAYRAKFLGEIGCHSFYKSEGR